MALADGVPRGHSNFTGCGKAGPLLGPFFQPLGGGKGGRAWADVADEAVAEVVRLLEEQGGSGYVRVEDWVTRYGSWLGHLRDFLESRPDKFVVVHGDGPRFSVALAAPQVSSAAASMPKRKHHLSFQAEEGGDSGAGKRARTSNAELLAERAIQEIERQLADPRNVAGNVWIDEWHDLYGSTLGTLRSFIESWPDKFVVTPIGGRKYSVCMAGEDA